MGLNALQGALRQMRSRNVQRLQADNPLRRLGDINF
jgi:hypothetical protein